MDPFLRDAPLESARFGLDIARLDLDGSEDPDEIIDLVAASGRDLVIARIPAEARLHPGQLNRRGCRVSLTEMDLTWEGAARPRADSGRVLEVARWERRHDELVGRIFEGYRNHMSRDGRSGRSVVADGYAEWAANHVGRDDSACLVLDDTNPVGLAAISIRPDDPRSVTIDLAGISPEARRRGEYGSLLDAVEDWALHRGIERISIATQCDNIAVQRAWARRGWLPSSAEWITHLRPSDSVDE